MAEQMVFPRVTGYGGVDVVSTQGLSVREYFAAMALQGLLAAGEQTQSGRPRSRSSLPMR